MHFVTDNLSSCLFAALLCLHCVVHPVYIYITRLLKRTFMNNDVINTKNKPKVSEQQLSVYVSYIMLKKCHVNAVALSRVVMEYGSLPTFIVCVCVCVCARM